MKKIFASNMFLVPATIAISLLILFLTVFRYEVRMAFPRFSRYDRITGKVYFLDGDGAWQLLGNETETNIAYNFSGIERRK